VRPARDGRSASEQQRQDAADEDGQRHGDPAAMAEDVRQRQSMTEDGLQRLLGGEDGQQAAGGAQPQRSCPRQLGRPIAARPTEARPELDDRDEGQRRGHRHQPGQIGVHRGELMIVVARRQPVAPGGP